MKKHNFYEVVELAKRCIQSCRNVVQSCLELSKVVQSWPEPFRVTQTYGKKKCDRQTDRPTDPPSYRDAKTGI